MEVDIWEAWSRWLAGELLGDAKLWGVPIQWWGRIGKLAQFAAGLVVVLDLIGPERLRAWGRQLGAVGPREGWARIKSAIRAWYPLLDTAGDLYYSGGYSRYDSSEDELSRERAGERFRRAPAHLRSRAWSLRLAGWGIGIALLFLVGIPLAHDRDLPEQVRVLLFFLVFVVPMLLGDLLIVGLLAGISFSYRMLVFAITRSGARLLDVARPAHPLRWLAFVAFVVGFHFDLLAS
jgi:hypothetical protein